MVDPGEERPHPGVVPGLAGGEGHRPIRPAVEGAQEGDDLAAPGGPAGQLEGPLDRLGAAVAEEHRVEPRGRHVHQGLGGGHQLGMVGGPRDVPETIDLLVHRPYHGGVPVPEVGDPDAAGEVEHRPAVDGVQPGPLSGVHDQVGVAPEGGRYQLTVLLQKGRDGHAVIGGRSVHGTSSRCVEGRGRLRACRRLLEGGYSSAGSAGGCSPRRGSRRTSPPSRWPRRRPGSRGSRPCSGQSRWRSWPR